MKRFLLTGLCATMALAIFSAVAQAQSPANATTDTTTSGGTSGGTGTGTGTGMRRRGGGEAIEERHAREIIRKYDKDGDHALNAAELAAFFEALHQRVADRGAQTAANASTPSPRSGKRQHSGTPEERAARAIERFDKNGDGKLEAGEVAALLRAVRERLLEEGGGQHPATPGNKPAGTPGT
jgi:hypothetical protein